MAGAAVEAGGRVKSKRGAQRGVTLMYAWLTLSRVDPSKGGCRLRCGVLQTD